MVALTAGRCVKEVSSRWCCRCRLLRLARYGVHMCAQNALSHDEALDLLARSIGPACHELRSPLAVVYGFARMLESDLAGSDPASGYVKHVVNGAERIDQLLEALGTIGRIAAGRIHPEVHEDVRIGSVIGAVSGAPPIGAELDVIYGEDVEVVTDPAWLASAVDASIRTMCIEETATVAVSWTVAPREVTIRIGSTIAVAVAAAEPERSPLWLNVARARASAIDAVVYGGDDEITITVPRPV